MKPPLFHGWILILLGVLLTSCAPVFSELQSARTVGENRIEVTPSFSTVNFTEDGESDGVQNHLGIQSAYGISSKLDIRLRYEYIWLQDDNGDNDAHVLGIGPKYSLLENKIAIAVPFGRAFGEATKDTWQVHPTFLFTIPAIKDNLDINLSPKYLLTLCRDCDDYIAINLGLSFSNDFTKWAIRPEYGILFDPGESGHFAHFSIGFSTAFGR
jgi:hypothetical protein